MCAQGGVSVHWSHTALSLCSASPCMVNLCSAGIPERFLQKEVSELGKNGNPAMGSNSVYTVDLPRLLLLLPNSSALLSPHEHQVCRHLTYTNPNLITDCAPSNTVRFQYLPGLLHSTTISSRGTKATLSNQIEGHLLFSIKKHDHGTSQVAWVFYVYVFSLSKRKITGLAFVILYILPKNSPALFWPYKSLLSK